MRDYAEIVSRLRINEKFFNERDAINIATLYRDATDAIEELLSKVPQWISVEERLPRPFVSVLVNIPGENPFPTVKEAFLEKTGMWYSIGFRYEQEEVTHWCEMPEPPKEVE